MQARSYRGTNGTTAHPNGCFNTPTVLCANFRHRILLLLSRFGVFNRWKTSKTEYKKNTLSQIEATKLSKYTQTVLIRLEILFSKSCSLALFLKPVELSLSVTWIMAPSDMGLEGHLPEEKEKLISILRFIQTSYHFTCGCRFKPSTEW